MGLGLSQRMVYGFAHYTPALPLRFAVGITLALPARTGVRQVQVSVCSVVPPLGKPTKLDTPMGFFDG